VVEPAKKPDVNEIKSKADNDLIFERMKSLSKKIDM